jgi:uncharacterized protein (TIGR00730 family)
MEKSRFYYDKKFLGAKAGRPLRILSEYLAPLNAIQRNNVKDTIVFYGSARIQDNQNSEINKYYQKAEELSYKLTKWNMNKYTETSRYIITSGAGPGIMSAANKGATKAGGKTIGLGISLPFEATNNKWITKGLNFVFHYFFMRKFWFIYLAKGIVVWPGGFGTLDELFDVLTLLETKKISRKIPIVLFGKDFWNGLIDWDKLVSNKLISKSDLDLFVTLDTVDETFDYLIKNMKK